MLGFKASEQATTHGLTLLSSFEKGAIIAGYWPIGDELDPRFLLHTLERRNFKLALPVITGKDKPLAFRLWGNGDPLEKGPFGTLQPPGDAPLVTPHVLLAPLLAFDADCYRLGWGGGFYDRTLALNTSIKAFGFAYAAQYVEHIPRSSYDWPMQGIITEAGVVLPKVQ